MDAYMIRINCQDSILRIYGCSHNLWMFYLFKSHFINCFKLWLVSRLKKFYILKCLGNYFKIVINKIIYKMTLLPLSQDSGHNNLGGLTFFLMKFFSPKYLSYETSQIVLFFFFFNNLRFDIWVSWNIIHNIDFLC